jgi:DNA polymerase kappa
MLDFTPDAIKAFMHDLSIRKIPGVGRVNERLLESIGIKVCQGILVTLPLLTHQICFHSSHGPL